MCYTWLDESIITQVSIITIEWLSWNEFEKYSVHSKLYLYKEKKYIW